jgi:hypothetical protein
MGFVVAFKDVLLREQPEHDDGTRQHLVDLVLCLSLETAPEVIVEEERKVLWGSFVPVDKR